MPIFHFLKPPTLNGDMMKLKSRLERDLVEAQLTQKDLDCKITAIIAKLDYLEAKLAPIKED